MKESIGTTIILVNSDAVNIEVDDCGFVTITPSELNDDGFYEEDVDLSIVMTLEDLDNLTKESFKIWEQLSKQI